MKTTSTLGVIVMAGKPAEDFVDEAERKLAAIAANRDKPIKERRTAIRTLRAIRTVRCPKTIQ